MGVKAGTGSDFEKYTGNVLTDNNIMNVKTQGTNCGTSQAVNCSDDSGAFGVLINGNDNEFSGNTVSGSNAASFDYGRDGGAFEIYNGSRNNIHHNVALDNNSYSGIGRSSAPADGNTFRYNLVRSTCGATCAEAKGLILNGPTNFTRNSTSTTASARFVNAPTDLHLTGTSPAIDRAGTGPSALDLGGRPVPQNGDCTGTAAADSGAYEFDSPNC